MNFEANDYLELSVYMSILSTYCHACFLNLSMICLPVLCFVSAKLSPFWIIRQAKENTPGRKSQHIGNFNKMLYTVA
jgi:hypothetical protein